MSFLLINPPPTVDIYPPADHRDMVQRLFERIGVPVRINAAAPQSAPTGGRSMINSAAEESLNCGEIQVLDYNAGTFNELRETWRGLCFKKVDVISMYIDMQNPLCPELTRRCEELGFLFAGVLPAGAGGKHALVLQYLNNYPIDYSLIKPYSPFAQELLANIKAADADEARIK